MGVLGDGSGWCFCSGGAKLERIKSSLLAAKGAAVAAVSFPGGGGGKGGSGFLIHRALLLTTHGTIPSAAAASAAEVRLSHGRLLTRLVPQRFFITSPILDLTIVGLDVADDESSSHGQQPQFLKTCLNPTLDLGSTVLVLGHNRRDMAVGEAKVIIATDNLIKFSTVEVLWRPGSAGFDMHGSLAFMVCDPMKLAPSTPTGYASASSTALLASRKDVPAQFGIPIPAVCEWLKQHWTGSLEDVSKPTMTPARLTSSGERSGRSSLGNLRCIKTTEREGGNILSSSQIPPVQAWQHGSCSSASAKISYGGKDSIESHSFHEQHELTSKMYKPKNEQTASLMDISFPPEHPRSIRLPLPLKQMMPDEEKTGANRSAPHETRPSNVRINCDALHNVAYQENCWSEGQSSSSPLEISELGDERGGFSSGEETMYSAETRESRNIPSPKEKKTDIAGRSQSFVNHSRWDSPKSVESSKGPSSKSHTFIPLRKPHLQAAAISQKSQVYFSPTVSSNMKKRNLSRIPMKPRQSAQVTSNCILAMNYALRLRKRQVRCLVVPSPTSPPLLSSPSRGKRRRESNYESTDQALPSAAVRPAGDPRNPRAIDRSGAMRQQRGIGGGRRREDPGLMTRAVDKVFRFVRLAEFEILFVLFFLIAFILFKDLMSRPQYNSIFVKKPDLDDAWP
ncbi:hypothetical protein EJB05_48093, partial [Eragrostis curvula]